MDTDTPHQVGWQLRHLSKAAPPEGAVAAASLLAGAQSLRLGSAHGPCNLGDLVHDPSAEGVGNGLRGHKGIVE
eukprot:1161471-Pelagomonas_calceolata.AAC.3